MLDKSSLIQKILSSRKCSYFLAYFDNNNSKEHLSRGACIIMCHMSMNRSAFALEIKRSLLAKENRLIELKTSYDKKFSEIPDNNTSEMWSELNLIEIARMDNPMAWDRVHVCVELAMNRNNILDIGFGSGIVEDLMSKRNSEIKISGIDIAKESVKKIRVKIPKGQFCIGSILDLPYRRSSFDCVLALEVMEHIQPSNTFIALGEVFRVLKRGGIFIVSVPLNEGLEVLVKNKKNFNAHVRVYTPELIKAELVLAGFSLNFERYLYAFHSFYKIKSIIARILKMKYKPNNIILVCQKN